MEVTSLPRGSAVALPRSRRVLAAFGDERLVEQVRRGNEAAFEAIYDRHHRGILSFCRHMLGSADEAEDAVQQTFVSAYDAIRADQRELKLKAWLYTIARNKSLSMLRARREQPSELDDVPTAGLADEVQQRSDLRELLRDMRELPEDQRAALVLSELGDLSHADIGQIVGVEPVKVKALVFQARSSLIENRNARETPCSEIREQLATLSGGALRRGPLRKHLKVCTGCRQFRDDVRAQRAMVAAVLPVVPSAGLKGGALAALGLGGGGGAGAATAGGAAAGGMAAVGAGGSVGGGLAGVIASVGGAKLAAAVVATVAAVGGGAAVSQVARDGDPSAQPTASPARDAAPAAAAPGPGASGGGPVTGRAEKEDDPATAKRRAAKRRAVAKRRSARRRAEEREQRSGGSSQGKPAAGGPKPAKEPRQSQQQVPVKPPPGERGQSGQQVEPGSGGRGSTPRTREPKELKLPQRAPREDEASGSADDLSTGLGETTTRRGATRGSGRSPQAPLQ